MVDQEIKITGYPSRVDPMECSFTVDRPVLEDRSFYFPSAEKAVGSPLAERLFAVPGVATVLVAHDTVTVTKDAARTWQEVGKEIGAAIRDIVRSGEPAVSPEAMTRVPPPDTIREVVQHLIDTQINPGIASHGGHVRLLDVRGNAVYIEMGGGCQGCGMANVTLRHGIEKVIREMVPEVGEILDVTDHAAGRNPFYASSAGH
jgi:Fe-S cluster biogenesis protein NfuA